MRRFAQVDVFTDEALRGNALAVVLDGAGLSDAQMAAFANWTHLSETTFVLPPTDARADYRVRIFTPTVELPFAGHPTLGTCHAWLAAGGQPREAGHVVQQCGVGLVRIRRESGRTGERLAFAAPPRRRSGPLDEETVERIARFLQVPRAAIVAHQHCDNGPGWKAVMLGSADEVLALAPRLGSEPDMEIGVVGPAPGKVGVVRVRGGHTVPSFEVRAFFPAPERVMRRCTRPGKCLPKKAPALPCPVNTTSRVRRATARSMTRAARSAGHMSFAGRGSLRAASNFPWLSVRAMSLSTKPG